jgi:hypothetical protein
MSDQSVLMFAALGKARLGARIGDSWGPVGPSGLGYSSALQSAESYPSYGAQARSLTHLYCLAASARLQDCGLDTSSATDRWPCATAFRCRVRESRWSATLRGFRTAWHSNWMSCGSGIWKRGGARSGAYFPSLHQGFRTQAQDLEQHLRARECGDPRGIKRR